MTHYVKICFRTFLTLGVLLSKICLKECYTIKYIALYCANLKNCIGSYLQFLQRVGFIVLTIFIVLFYGPLYTLLSWAELKVRP